MATADVTTDSDTGATPGSESGSEWRLVASAIALVVLHLLANGLHTASHLGTGVFLPPAVSAVVVLSVYVLPLVGVVLLWRGAGRLGGAVLAWSFAASLAIGLAFHFVVPGPDNLASIGAGPWAAPFTLSAVAVALVDGAGALVGVALWWAKADGPAALPASGRLAGVPWTGFRPLVRLTYRLSRRWFGAVPASLPVMANHRGVLAGTSAFEVALLTGEAVDDRLKALAVQKAAMEVECPFCVDLGAAEAAEVGVTSEQLRDLPAFEDSDAFAEDERLVLRYAVAMSETPTAVPDELFYELADAFEPPQLVELTAAIAWENYRARFNHAVGLDAQGFADEAVSVGGADPADPADPGSDGAEHVSETA